MTDAPPRVAFDATPAISGSTGVARYVNELGAALERRGTTLRRFAVGRAAFPVPAHTRHLRVPARLLEPWWRAVRQPTIERLLGGVELVHATGLLTPATRRPLVMTVHDMAALRHPELHPDRHVRQQRAQLALLDRAAVIVTVSRATADDLVELGIPAARLVVAHPGRTELPPESAAPPGLPAGPYLLTVGETSPRKGYPVLLRALARLGGDLPLVMAGPPAGDEECVRALAETPALRPRVRRLGAVGDATLAALYRGALALCFPSVAEGFGSPVLEAMGAGLPVVASDIPVLRELAGDAALFVAHDDQDAWAAALERIAGEERLRRELSERGRRRAAEFTWERSAAATLAAYRLALAGA
jgi:glycosyltransferase involved in cell wall biosynthesis